MDAPNIAIFADFENVVIGAKDAKYDDFDIHLVLQRLLDKGNIVVKKAYADWDRYKSSKKPMHESAFELIEIPHVSYSGKNSADIRMVVDALDLCYTKAHVDLFVIISGDSDFSPLVSKLRENNKKVIGVGVKNSSSDLLIENCDEYIFYDDLVRDKRKSKKAEKSKGRDRQSSRPRSSSSSSNGATSPSSPPESAPKSAPATQHTKADEVGSKEEALDLVLDTTESLFRERDENVWGSMVKQTIKRKKPHFSETFYGYRNFSDLLEDAEKRGLLELKKDEKSGGYIILGFGPQA
ncbi:NYN domain-containing protein [Bradymonadaceae bacterium TMQ3]|uniref:NYN domain-containing protein n=1 Tax=Lujinxingia sediminis TaxID=2480984 RepID=A0ABY0CQ52_9DELT|nr:NYN domain-containing protein [Lujinxingia sediminis]RDV36832.1 NYN domain-containing protein [Bradymonadaceae bacterium TMQ3]RVU42187.1 NYN domain-containing protein [Lujinxingia sediminis]TXC69455.1 NYN domain-containing protein [Bradymonadales bacterium TMQ1]